MTGVHAPGLPEDLIRARARRGTAEVFPSPDTYGRQLFGAGDTDSPAGDPRVADELDAARLVPPVFMPQRLEKLIDLGREPVHDDVDLTTSVGGFASPLPLYVSAFGSTRIAAGDAGIAASRQAGQLGIPMVIGENLVPVGGYRRDAATRSPILARLRAYADACPPDRGGVVVQQSTEDADSEVWNLVYSDPSVRGLVDSGRLAFELKTGQGAKPGLGGMTVVGADDARRLADRFAVCDVLGGDGWLRCATPGTFTEEILRQQVRFMRNNFPRARVWVKFHPGRDVAHAAATAWRAGADAVTVDGAQGGTGWAPRAFVGQVGLPLAECLRRIGRPEGCLLVTGRIWEGGRAVRALAAGATAVGLGRAALLAVDEDAEAGLVRLVQALALEARLLVSALGRYRVDALTCEDLWWPGQPTAISTKAGQPVAPIGGRA
ncbi:glutamate synthase conserved region-containing protein [Micromonospora nigra]|uniref:Glutamate synthase conserved region-containing protein n=1 Tax=Micromonospora nigra TaxID=145857 RepID=A0A1C6SZU8_9ACTN|nr:glutamate synthase-related protein [Micromonospora nigra]SCL35001.1 glutamate synthase conserved region-containing protein [Micromonospora nigra]